jgi:hypothetical protein
MEMKAKMHQTYVKVCVWKLCFKRMNPKDLYFNYILIVFDKSFVFPFKFCFNLH